MSVFVVIQANECTASDHSLTQISGLKYVLLVAQPWRRFHPDPLDLTANDMRMKSEDLQSIIMIEQLTVSAVSSSPIRLPSAVMNRTAFSGRPIRSAYARFNLARRVCLLTLKKTSLPSASLTLMLSCSALRSIRSVGQYGVALRSKACCIDIGVTLTSRASELVLPDLT